MWTLPALLLLFDRGLRATGWRRPVRLGLCAGVFGLLSSRVIWSYAAHFTDTGLLWSNAYVYLTVILLLACPVERGAGVGSGQAPGVAQLGQVEDRPVGAGDGVGGGRPVGGETGLLVEPPSLVIRGEHP